MLLLDFERFENFGILLCNLWIVRGAIVNITQNRECFFAATMFVQIPWRLGESED